MRTCKSILKVFRERARLNQEDAAERLCISGHTLSNYEGHSIETRKNAPPEELILKMMELYIDDKDPVARRINQLHMGILYLYDTNPIFKHIFSGIELKDMPTAFIKYQTELEDVQNMEKHMRRVIVDNQIDEDEIELTGSFLKELLDSTFANIGFAISVIEKTPFTVASVQPQKQKLKRRQIHVENERVFTAWR